jgi:phytoene dehydrogenase-like protein
MHEREPVVIVGGGIGGLAVASYLARAGKRVTIYEKATHPGGRAQTRTRSGFHFNLGPHALYSAGEGAAVLKDLGVRVTGGLPSGSGAYALRDGRRQALPTGFLSLLTTGLLRLPAKLELGRLLGGLQRIDSDALASVSVEAWLADAVRHEEARGVIRALVRLSTYANDPERLSAGTALGQLKLALAKGVRYLDGGWQTIVEGLRAVATAAGAEIVTGVRVTGIEHDGAVRAVRLADGSLRPAATVVIAGTPGDAAALMDTGHPLAGWAAAAIPVQAACLNVGLSHLPDPRALFGLGIDRPLYCSVHSASARLAPAGGALIQLAKYLPSGAAADPRADERELEELLDAMQPGWRRHVVERQFLPGMLVSGALVTAANGGLVGRPGPAVPCVRGLYVVGDWVGPEGLLADATLASARRAAALVGRGERTSTVAAA